MATDDSSVQHPSVNFGDFVDFDVFDLEAFPDDFFDGLEDFATAAGSASNSDSSALVAEQPVTIDDTPQSFVAQQAPEPPTIADTQPYPSVEEVQQDSVPGQDDFLDPAWYNVHGPNTFSGPNLTFQGDRVQAPVQTQNVAYQPIEAAETHDHEAALAKTLEHDLRAFFDTYPPPTQSHREALKVNELRTGPAIHSQSVQGSRVSAFDTIQPTLAAPTIIDLTSTDTPSASTSPVDHTYIDLTHTTTSSVAPTVFDTPSVDLTSASTPSAASTIKEPKQIDNRKLEAQVLKILQAQNDSPSPAQDTQSNRKKARIAKVGRQPRATKEQIDALVGFTTKEEARAVFVSHTQAQRRQNPVQQQVYDPRTGQYYAGANVMPMATPTANTFPAVEAAKRRLERAGPDIRYHVLNIPDDDVSLADDHMITVLSRILFTSILQPPCPAPPQIADEDKAKFDKVQADAFRRCQKLLACAEVALDAEARCVLVVDAAYRLHTAGIPVADLDAGKRDKGKLQASGFLVDADSPFLLRVHKIWTIVLTNKLIALDVLNGSGIDALVRSPRECVHRKVLNFRGNDTKAKLTEMGLEAATVQHQQQQEQEQERDQQQGVGGWGLGATANQQGVRGRKRKVAEADESTFYDLTGAVKKQKNGM